MIKFIEKTLFTPGGITVVALFGLPGGRTILRKALKALVSAGLSVSNEFTTLVNEVKEENASKKAEQKISFEPASHTCIGRACKCMIPHDDQYCNEFCRDVETSTDIMRCGCGHNACDITKQLGNEATFDRTTG